MRVAVAVTGASGAHLGIRLYRELPSSIQKYLILTRNAKTVFEKEGLKKFFDAEEIWHGPASGSFGLDILFIAPCSMNTLAKIAVGIADDLVTRAAAVAIKEKKTLLLAPREIPFSPLALENMLKLSRLNVIIAPPVLGYYSGPKNLEEMENFIVGRWMDLVGIENDLYKRWKGS